MDAPEAFEKWWQALPLRNGEITADHIRQAWDAGLEFEKPQPIWNTTLPFEISAGDGALIAKAMRAYRPETSDEEGVVNFFIDEFEKLDAGKQ
jgi:hypothetical protein